MKFYEEDEDRVRRWFLEKHPHLDDRPPIYFVKINRVDVLLKKVKYLIGLA